MLVKEQSIQEVVRQELLKKDIAPNCEIAYLSAIIRGTGEVNISNKGFSIDITNENKDLIKVITEIIERRYQAKGIVKQSTKDIGMRQVTVYRASYAQPVADRLLKDTYIINGYELITGIADEVTNQLPQARTYLRGIFLSCGYLSAPADSDATKYDGKKGYHLELILNSNLIKQDLSNLIIQLCSFDKNAIKARKNAFSLYIKSAQHISDFLAAMEANQGVIMLQEIMANRAMRNHLNRGNNAILANIDKSILAAEKQITAIDKIKENKGIETLDKRLQQTAKLRMKHPNATLNELAELSNSSRSKIYHRLRKIQDIAENIKES